MSTFYRINEIVNLIGLSAHTLRYYERIGLVEPIARASSRHRVYSEADVRWLQFVQRLRGTGMSIAQMLRYAELRRLGERLESVSERRVMLEQHAGHLSAQLVELQAHLLILQQKIEAYQVIEGKLKNGAPSV